MPLARLVPTTRIALLGLLCVLAVAYFPFAEAEHQLTLGNTFLTPLSLCFGVAGYVVARHQPRDPIGWTLLAAGVFLGLTSTASMYAIAVYTMHRSGFPLGSIALLLQPSWAPGILMIALSVVLFPDGRLPSGRWRWVLWALFGTGAVWVGGAFAISLSALGGGSIRVDSGGNLLQATHPTGGWVWWGLVQNVFFVLLLVVGIGSLVSRIPLYRRAAGERRQQLKALLAGAGVTLVGAILRITLSGVGGVIGFVGNAGALGLIALPLSIAVGILRYRLYDIDRLISRTVSYTLLTTFLVGVFSGLVLLATRVLPFSSPVGVAAATLAAAALVSPLRGRLQRLVDRRFNRARYDAEALVTTFASRLRDAVDVETVRSSLVDVAVRAVEPSHVSLWIRAE